MTRVTLSNTDLERIRALRATGMTWRRIQDQSPKYRDVPLQSLWKMCKVNRVFPMYQKRDDRKRLRIVAQVTEAEYNAVKAAAESAGVTMAEYIRRMIPHAP